MDRIPSDLKRSQSLLEVEVILVASPSHGAEIGREEQGLGEEEILLTSAVSVGL